MSQARALLGKSSISLAVRVGGLAVSLPATVILSRVLGIEAFGIYTIALSYASIAAIAIRLGLENTALRFVAVYRERQEGRPLLLFFNYGLRVMAAAWLLICALAWVSAEHMGPDGHEFLMIWAGVVAVALALIGYLSAVLRAFDRIFESQFYEQMLRPSLIIAMIATLWLLRGKIGPALAMSITASSLVIASGIAWIRSRQLVTAIPMQGSAGDEKALWLRMGSVVAVVSFVVELLNQLEVILLGALASGVDSALFVASQRLASLAGMGMAAIVSVSAPQIASAFHKRDQESLANLAKVGARFCFLTTTVLAAGLIFAGPLLLQLWGSEFTVASPVLNVLLIGALCNAATGSSGFLTILTGHERASLAILLFALCATVLAECFLIPRYGAFGAAIGSAAGLSLWNVLMAGFVRLRLGIDCTIFGLPASPRPAVFDRD